MSSESIYYVYVYIYGYVCDCLCVYEVALNKRRTGRIAREGPAVPCNDLSTREAHPNPSWSPRDLSNHHHAAPNA